MSSLTWLDTTPSTNSAIRGGAYQHGDAVATLNQTEGRGRIGRQWVELPGRGLALSVKLDPRRLAVNGPLTLVPLVAGVALVDVIERESPAARLWVKWPNDVYLGDHKVSGVLTELVEPATMVVGIGVNVSHAVAELPLPTATSLSIHGINFEPEALAEQWVQHFFALLDTLGTEELLDHVRRRLGLVGEQVTVNMPDNSVIEGTVIELEATGALTVDDGKLRHTVLAGDVRTLRPRT